MNPAAFAVRGLWRCAAAPAVRRFVRAMKDPERAQRGLLAGILRCNGQTEFGRAHGFTKLKSAEDFQNAVPPREYIEFKPWIDAAAAGKSGVLTPGKPLAFLPTSGTSTGAKLIPWTASLKREFHAALGPWMHGFMRSHPAAWRGPAYWSLSPPVWPDDLTSGGIPIGFDSDASYLPALLQPFLGAAFAVPSAMAGFRDPEVWRYGTLLCLLAAGDLSMVSVWSPTFLTSLLEPLAGWWPALLKDLGNGSFHPPGGNHHGPPPIRSSARRAVELRGLSPAGCLPPYERIWPRLAAISCWTDAAAREPSRRLARLFPQARVVGKGLVATEGMISIPWPEADAPALALTSHFFEFADGAGRFHPAWDLTEGACYSVLLTTGGGLYRYRMHDRVRVVGFHRLCPLLEFIGREGITCDLCGEKLAEPFVRDCFERVSRELGQVWEFALLAPSGNGERPGYSLFLSDASELDPVTLARAMESALCGNVHYDHARRIGQLAPVDVLRVPGDGDWAWSRFEKTQAERGQRLGDIKPTALDSKPGWELVFETGGRNPMIVLK